MNDAKECVLVCLSSSPSNHTVVHTAIKMADAFHAELIALFVEIPKFKFTSEQERHQFESNRKLAEKNGAKFTTMFGEDVAMLIAQYAKACGATKIVIGRPNHHRVRWFYQKDIPQRLIQLIPELEIYIVPSSTPTLQYNNKQALAAFSLRSLVITLGILVTATFLGLVLKNVGFTDVNIITVYIMSVMFVSYFTEGYLYGAVASITSVLVFNYLFTEPRFSFAAYDTGYPLTFFVMFIAAFLTSSLTARAREESKANAQKAYRTEILFTASRNLQHADTEEEILHETAVQILKLTGNPVVLYPIRQGELADPLLFYPNEGENSVDESMCQIERPIAEEAYRRNEQTGASTKIAPESKFWYLAIRGRHNALAVAGVAINSLEPMGNFEKSLLLALLGECGVALEKQQLRENQALLSIEAQREKMRSNLLRAISHDLRTPLTSISGNAEILLDNHIVLAASQQHQLFDDIYEDSVWLIRLVENLLSITRMDNKTLALQLKPELISDVIDEAISHSARRAQHHHLQKNEIDEYLMAKVEASLIVQVLVNLIDNAVKYTPSGSDIIISTKQLEDKVIVSVCDNGPGISDEGKAKLFEMFYVGRNHRSDARRGLGLGLALCKAIVTAHGGEIWAEDNAPQGICFAFSLFKEEEISNE